MNYTMSGPFANWASALVIPLAICAGLLLSHRPASAAEKSPSDTVAGILQAAQSATSAEVFIVPNTLSSILPITQEQVPRYGCSYQVNPSEIRELLEVINDGDITGIEPVGQRFDLRILIRLYRDGAPPTVLAFKKFRWPDEERLYGLVNGTHASAAAHFPESLKRWATGKTPKQPSKYTLCPDGG